MLSRRGQPLPRPLAGWSVVATFVLIGVALLITVWTTRSSVVDASEALKRGQALALQQAVRGDLQELERIPTLADLQTILDAHQSQGLRYLGRRERQIFVDEVGTAVAAGTVDGDGDSDVEIFKRGQPQFTERNGRMRLPARPFRSMRNGGRPLRFVIEVEPVQARQLRDAATVTAGIGALAAASLLAVAIYLVRREAQRQREERERERERRLANLGEMSAVLAHEIKNPLASLKGNAQLLSAMLAKETTPPDKAKAKAARVVDEAIRLEQLVGDLLEFIRTGEIRRTVVDPAAVVREAAMAVSPDVEIVADGAPHTWSLDAGRIREVIVNLVDNATAAGPPVQVTVRAEGAQLVIEVSDHGPGVAEEDRERIFEPFFTGKTQGTGLGLAVVRRVIEQHGGTIAVLANPGGGARFRATFPQSSRAS